MSVVLNLSFVWWQQDLLPLL